MIISIDAEEAFGKTQHIFKEILSTYWVHKEYMSTY